MKSPRLQEYICDYIDGTMEPAMRDVFEDFMNQNELVRDYVQAAIEGREQLRKMANLRKFVHKPVVQLNGDKNAKPFKWNKFRLFSMSLTVLSASVIMGHLATPE